MVIIVEDDRVPVFNASICVRALPTNSNNFITMVNVTVWYGFEKFPSVRQRLIFSSVYSCFLSEKMYKMQSKQLDTHCVGLGYFESEVDGIESD